MKQFLIVISSIIFFTGCFNVWLPSNSVTTILLCLIYLFFRRCHSIYKVQLRIIVLGFLLSWISCYIYREQSFVESFLAIPEYYALFLYFLFKGYKISPENGEKALICLILLFDVMFIAQYYLYSYGINFMNIPEWSFGEEGGLRMRACACGLYSIGIFMGLTKWDNTKKMGYFIMMSLSLFCLMLTGYRQLTFSVVFTFFIYYLFYKKIGLSSVKTLFVLVILVYIVIQIPAVQEKIDGMVSRSQNNNYSNAIRFVQLDFYYNHYFHDYIEMFLGSGIPYVNSEFGHYKECYLDPNHVSWVDWGFLGQSWVIGVITVIGYILLSIKAIILPSKIENKYIALWYIYLLISVTNYEFFRYGNFYVHALALYLAEAYSEKCISKKK